jgi:hypothetical protein
MIVYWCKSKKKKDKNNEEENKIFPKINKAQNTNNIIQPKLLNNEEIIYDSQIDTKNYSFISQDSNSILNIFETETNESSSLDLSNKSEKKNNSLNEIKIKFELLNFEEKEKFIKKEFFEKIENNKITNNSTAIFLILMKLCNKSEYLLNIMYNCVIGNFLKILLSKYNYIFLNEIYDIFNHAQINNFIQEIIKNFPILIKDKNGFQVILFFIMKKNIEIINFCLYISLQFFLQYSFDLYSSQIICSLYSLNNDYISHQLNIKLIQNIKFIVQNQNGNKIISFAKQFSNQKDNLFIEQILGSIV